MFLGSWIVYQSPRHDERMFITKYKIRFSNTFGITQVITKAYQVAEVNQNILICTISMSDILPTQKVRGVHKVKHFNFTIFYTSFLLIFICNMTIFRKKKFFDLLTPPRGRGCIKGQNSCLHHSR